jgi:hypothetical protein
MISVLLYGRNDSYGYNLHKRAAISLNCIAEVLTDPDDEILFVDYNTADDFPTFPEAIQDTLTDRVKKMLRILRLRPKTHERFRSRTHLFALEPISRNVAARRSNPNNRWLLSTNTDIVLAPQRVEVSLSELVRDLPPGLWQAPRLEIPETLWEGLDRKEPKRNIAKIREWGRTLHLDEIVLGNPQVLYDGPGDFQLIDRAGLFECDGFHEDMLLGWHVDANISVRMALRYGAISDLGAEVFAYHCDHTRQVTPAHSHNRKQNSIERFVDQVKRADIPEQREVWGCPDDPIEEIRLHAGSQVYVTALTEALGAPADRPYLSAYTSAAHDKVDYDPRHVLPFLTDLFSASPRNTRVGWWGFREDTLLMFSKVWKSVGFLHPILIDATFQAKAPPPSGDFELVEDAGKFAECDTLIFDFGDAYEAGHTQALAAALTRAVAREHADWNLPGSRRRRFVGINCINNRFEHLFCKKVGASATPYSSRLRHGYALPPISGSMDWLPRLSIAAGGERVGEAVLRKDTVMDWMFYGPYECLPAGAYRFRLGLESHSDGQTILLKSYQPVAVVEVVSRSEILAMHVIRCADIGAGIFEFICHIPLEVSERYDYALEVRARPVMGLPFGVTALSVERLAQSPDAARPILLELDWLPFLQLGAAGRWSSAGTIENQRVSGVIAYGPYWHLPAGVYEAELELSLAPFNRGASPVVTLASQFQGLHYGFAALRATRSGDHVLKATVVIDAASASRSDLRLEFVVSTSGGAAVTLRRLLVSCVAAEALPEAVSMDLLPLLPAADGGVPIADRAQFFAETSLRLEPGTYRIKAAAAFDAQLGKKPVVACVVQQAESTLAHALWTGGQLREEAETGFELASAADVRLRLWSTGAGEGLLTQFTLVRQLGVAPPARDSELLPALEGSEELPVHSFHTREEDWTAALEVGAAGRRTGQLIESRRGIEDFVFYGAYRRLPVGSYEARLSLKGTTRWWRGAGEGPVAMVEVVENEAPIARKVLFADDFGPTTVVPFRIEPGTAGNQISGDLQLRLRSLRGEVFRASDIVVAPTSGAEPTAGAPSSLLPYLLAGDYGIWRGRNIHRRPGGDGNMAYGPYWHLEPGAYVAEFEMYVADAAGGGLEVDVALDTHVVSRTKISPTSPGLQRLEVVFHVPQPIAEGCREIETRVWVSGSIAASLNSVKVRRREDQRSAE